MQAILSVTGFILLITGHQAAWLFAAGVGFVASAKIIGWFAPAQAPIQSIVYSLIIAASAGLLANQFKKAITILAAGVATALFLLQISEIFNIGGGWISWTLIVAGGFIGGLLVSLWGTLSLIFIAASFGAGLISHNFHMDAISPTIVFVIFFLIGILAQWILYQYNKPEFS